MTKSFFILGGFLLVQMTVWASSKLIDTPVSLLASTSDTGQVIMAIFAHPDDETTIGPVLAKYAAMGHSIYLVITTDGRHGITEHAHIPAGDSLVDIREQEGMCSCKALGIHPPIFLGLQDGLRGTEGMSGIFSELALMKVRLDSTINAIRPNIIITFGPDGDSGHPDHRLTADVVTEVLLQKPWPKDLSLYYFSWTKEQSARYEGWNLNYIDSSNADVMIEFDRVDEQKHFRSIRCYESQYDRKAMSDWIKLEQRDLPNQLFFRSYQPASKMVRRL